MRRTFYLIDRENNNKKRRITWKFILNHFNSSDPSFHYYPKIIDLERFAKEMDEINYTFKIEKHRKKKHESHRID